jgi:hypothetical protein
MKRTKQERRYRNGISAASGSRACAVVPKRSCSPAIRTDSSQGEAATRSGWGRLRARFEQWFYSEMTDPQIARDAFDALKAALRAREPWAHAIYWQRMLPPDSLNVRVSRGNDYEQFDYTKLSDAELEAMERILERARVPIAQIEGGEIAAQPADVH